MYCQLKSTSFAYILALTLLNFIYADEVTIGSHLSSSNAVKELGKIETTIAPAVKPLIDPISAAPELPANKLHTTVAAITFKLHSTVAPIIENAIALSTVVPANHTSTLVTEASVASLPTTLSPVTTSTSLILPTISAPILMKYDEHGHENETLQKFCDYLKPICESLDKIQPKQLFKIQTQFKQFVQHTNGKLGICFLEHYSFDPNLKPLAQADLSTICASKKLAPSLKGSYKSFQACAEKNWDAAVDKDLDRIMADRATHDHSVHETAASGLEHSEDEMSFISEVVSQVFGDDKSLVNNSDIKVIDVSATTTTTTTHKPLLHVGIGSVAPSIKALASKAFSLASTTLTPAAQSQSELLNDPNTVLVFVDNSNGTTTAPLPHKEAKNSTVIALHTTPKPLDHSGTSRSSDLGSTLKPEAKSVKELPTLAAKISHEVKPTSLGHKLLASTEAPDLKLPAAISKLHTGIAESSATTLKPAVILTTTKKVEALLKSTKAPLAALDSTAKPTLATTATEKTSVAPLKSKLVSTSAPSVSPKSSPKPLETLEQVLRRQEKEKQELDDRLKIEREKVLKQLQKKQDEIDAKNAMKALQLQREASTNQGSDLKLHQLEHDRQMAIDPIGHQIKHQQYELNKQQKALGPRRGDLSQ